jgi:uncharacterized protein YfdQ (DUF2303 family)
MEDQDQNLSELLDKALAIGAAQGKLQRAGDGALFAVVPDGYTITSLDDFAHAHAPRRVRAQASFDDLGSFVQYIRRHRTDQTSVWGDPTAAKFEAVIDWHSAQNHPSHAEHRAHFQTQLSEQWKTWVNFAGKPHSQEEFLEFIEAHGRRVVVENAAENMPPYLQVLQAARELEGTKEVAWRNAVRQKDGRRVIQYVEQGRTTLPGSLDGVEVFDAFLIAIPVFFSQKPVQIECRFRYRIQSGGLSLWFDIYEQDKLKREAFESFFADAAVLLAEGPGVPLYLGRSK